MEGSAVRLTDCCGQVFLPRAMCVWVLRCAAKYRRVSLSVCPPCLCPATRNLRRMGLVHLGYVLPYSPYIVPTLTMRLVLSLASVNFLDGTKLEKQRTMLAVYPLLYVAFPYSRVCYTECSLNYLQPILLYSSVDDCYRVVTGLVSNVYASVIRNVASFKCVRYLLLSSLPTSEALRPAAKINGDTYVHRRTNQIPVCP